MNNRVGSLISDSSFPQITSRFKSRPEHIIVAGLFYSPELVLFFIAVLKVQD
jgi:hypothetical protein